MRSTVLSLLILVSQTGFGATPSPLAQSQNWKPSDFPQLDCSKSVKPGEVEIKQLALGSVNRDGQTDLFLAVSCVASTSSWPTFVYVFHRADASDAPVFVSRLLDEKSGFEKNPISIDVKAGEGIVIDNKIITITSKSRTDTDANCCPSMRLIDTFKAKGHGFVKINRIVENDSKK